MDSDGLDIVDGIDDGTEEVEEAASIITMDSPATLAILNRIFLLQRSGNLPQGVSMTALLNILRASGNDDEEDGGEDDEDDDSDYSPNQRRSRTQSGPHFVPVTEPQEAGVDLLYGGTFGRVANKIRARADIPKRNMNSYMRQRWDGRRRYPRVAREDISSNLVPNTNGTAVANYANNIYTGSYSPDSSFYYTCSQDFRLYIYDSAMPPASPDDYEDAQNDHNIQTTMAVKRRIQGAPGRWTVTDASISPDNQRMIYSSITPTVHMTSTVDEDPTQHPITFSGGNHGLYSCTFSADGNEIIAGGNGNIFVYDLLSDRETVNIRAHNDDVNSCCWADTSSGNVLVSASDDSFLKVWDRRSLGTSPKPSGVLMGHTEGITYVSAKGDGRYVISNGKDQAVRLWDLRKMRSPMDHDREARKHYGVGGFDYRYPPYPKPRYDAHPMDCSVMTYRGHSVMRTLIRCKFSPVESTGGQYIYSGSADGRVHIWSLDGTLVEVLDCTRSLPMGHNPSAPEVPNGGAKHRVCVRDVSWNSREPVLMSAAWSNSSYYGSGNSILARHEWKGLNKLGGSLEDWNQRKEEEAREGDGRRQSRRLSVLQSMPGYFVSEDDDDDDEYSP